jgi:hypothetical protein
LAIGVLVGIVEVVVVALGWCLYCQGLWGAEFAPVLAELSDTLILDIQVNN